jgi:hypothetical protein
MRVSPARAGFGLIAALVVVALAVQIPLTADNGDEFFTSSGARIVNLFFYFTIMSNLLVAGVSAALAIDPERQGRTLDVLRLAGLICIVVTGAVYWSMLAADNPTEGIVVLTDYAFHLVVPLLTVAGWALYGPRRRIDSGVVARSLAVPAAWLAVVLVRGAIIDWYPYPFIDVVAEGYLATAINCVVIALAFAALGFAAMGIDRRLPIRTGR